MHKYNINDTIAESVSIEFINHALKCDVCQSVLQIYLNKMADCKEFKDTITQKINTGSLKLIKLE